MFDTIKKIIKYPRLTLKYPNQPMDSSLFIGKPVIDQNKCTKCFECVNKCPSGAISPRVTSAEIMETSEKQDQVMEGKSGSIGINLDLCIFCARCEDVCLSGAVTMTHEFELATKSHSELRHTSFVVEERDILDESYEIIGEDLQKKIKNRLGKSLNIREVNAGSCNACDYEINALNNPFNDIERFGIHFVASPRHADMLLVTGTATRNMELALIKTYNATPDPKIVVAVGACALSGGIFRDNYATRNGIDCIVPVDVYIPGCPPRPQAILFGILKALDRVKS